ncbi:MAG: hypothetical protein ACR2KF_00515 [Nitrososphaeraceae archaeon]
MIHKSMSEYSVSYAVALVLSLREYGISKQEPRVGTQDLKEIM